MSKLPDNNISISLVRSTLGITTNNVGLLCKHSNVNKWSKHKPVVLSKAACQDFDPTLPDYDPKWWQGKDGNCGFRIPRLAQVPDANIINWEYIKPVGGQSEPFRLGDFSGYTTDSNIPVIANYTYKNIEINKLASSAGFRFSFNIPHDSGVVLRINDFGSDIVDYYLSVEISRGTRIYYYSDTTVIKDSVGEIFIPAEDIPQFTAGSWIARFFLSSKILGKNESPVFMYPIYHDPDFPAEIIMNFVEKSPFSIQTSQLAYYLEGPYYDFSAFAPGPIQAGYRLASRDRLALKLIIKSTSGNDTYISPENLRIEGNTLISSSEKISFLGNFYDKNKNVIPKGKTVKITSGVDNIFYFYTYAFLNVLQGSEVIDVPKTYTNIIFNIVGLFGSTPFVVGGGRFKVTSDTNSGYGVVKDTYKP